MSARLILAITAGFVLTELETLHVNACLVGQVRSPLFPHQNEFLRNSFGLLCSGKTCSERITQCMPGQCLNGGTCVITLSNSQCLCASGWGGPFCGDPLDQCQGQPCHNGGICESGPGWFRCVCAMGFSGPDCRINVNECSPQPCLGGATCQDGIGGFTCICPPGRQGNRCEIRK